jgi:hypothetical protein
MFKRNVILVLLACLFALVIAAPTTIPSKPPAADPAVIKQKIAEFTAANNQTVGDIATKATWWGAQRCPCRSYRDCWNARTRRWDRSWQTCTATQYFAWRGCPRTCGCGGANKNCYVTAY